MTRESAPSLARGADALPAHAPTVVHMLAEAAAARGHAAALVCGDERLDFAGYAGAVAGLAAELARRDLSGQRVATVMGNSIDMAIAVFAIQAAGAQLVPLNPAYTSHELQPILADADPALVFADAEVVETVEAAMGALGATVWVAQGKGRLVHFTDAGERLDDWLPSPEDLSILQYTGGTTGRSKGVNARHGATAINVAQREALLPTRRGEDRVLAITPLFHVYALHMCLYLGVYAQSTVVILRRYHPEQVLEAVERERITLFSGSPTIFNGLMGHARFRETDFSSLRLCFSGASALAEETLRKWEAAAGCPVCEGFGQSESGPVLAFNPAAGPRKPGSVGIPVPRTAIMIAGQDGDTPAPRGEVGEILARGPQLMDGYRNLPEQTAEALAGGWLHTGDLGFLDEDGYLHVVDRKKDLIIVGGFNVYPRELEEVLYACPGVAEAAVVGEPDAYRGEVPVAFVVPGAGRALDPDQLTAWVGERLTKYKWPARIHIVDALPKTVVGKIDKKALRKEVGA